MVALEQEWLASGLPVAALMEKVGLAMTAWCLARPELLANGVLVLVGPGHNGGDGLVVARELSQAGVAVRIWCPLPLRQPPHAGASPPPALAEQSRTAVQSLSQRPSPVD